MAWVTPKEDWISDDVVAPADLNNIGGDLSYLKTHVDAVEATQPEANTEGTFDLTFTSMFSTTPLTRTVRWWMRKTTGNIGLVCLALPELNEDSSSTQLYATGMPEALRNSTARVSCIVIKDTAKYYPGMIQIWDSVNSRTNFYIRTGATEFLYNDWTMGFKKGFPAQVICYQTST